jgi:hypothetical protein
MLFVLMPLLENAVEPLLVRDRLTGKETYNLPQHFPPSPLLRGILAHELLTTHPPLKYVLAYSRYHDHILILLNPDQ